MQKKKNEMWVSRLMLARTSALAYLVKKTIYFTFKKNCLECMPNVMNNLHRAIQRAYTEHRTMSVYVV